MARFLVRSLISTFVTMFLVSVLLWVLLEVATGDVAVKLLGVFSTPEQRASYRAQLGLDAPSWQRYLDWLVGSDWRAESQVGFPLVTATNQITGERVWWADVDGTPTQWRLEEGELLTLQLQPDGTVATVSYTHLDVYKRQSPRRRRRGG